MAEIINLIQRRYGWSDEEILSIPYSRLLKIFEELSSLEQDKKREMLFLGWQLHFFNAVNPIQSFEEYCRLFGMSKDDEEPKKLEKVSVEEVKKKTEDILRLFVEKGGEKANGII